MNLCLDNYIRIYPVEGLIWNNLTSRYMGHVNSTGYIAVGWKYQGRTIHTLAHRVI